MYYNNQGGGNNRQGQGQHQGQGNPFNFMGQNQDFLQGFQNFQQNFGNAFGTQPAGMGQSVHFGQHHAQSQNAGGRNGQNRSDNQIDISNHSVSMTLMEPSESVILRGHNCKIEIGAGNTISNLVITGHNNRIFSKNQSSASENQTTGVVDTIDVMGHNNRIENIIANNLKVGGHNNRFQSVQCSAMDDTGICNQFNHCQQLQQPQRQQQPPRQQQQQQQRQPQQYQRQQYQQPQEVAARNEEIEDEVEDENAYDSEDEDEGDDVEDYSDEGQEQSTGITTGMNRQDQDESSNDQDDINEEDLIRQANEQEQDGVYSTDFDTQREPRQNIEITEPEEDSDREDIDEQIHQEEGLLGEDEIEEIDTQFEMMNQAFNQQQARPSIRQHQQHHTQTRQSINQPRVNNVQQQNRSRRAPAQAPTAPQQQQRRTTNRMPNGSHQSYTYSNVSGANPNDPNIQQFVNGAPTMPQNFGQQPHPNNQQVPNPNVGAQPGMATGNQPNNLFNLSGIMNDVQNMLNNIQTQQPGIQINFNGNYYQQPNQRGQQQNYQQYTNSSGQQNFVYDGSGAHQNVPNPHEYYEEYGEEDGENPVDEDGQPMPSPEDIKNVINAIPSFKYEEKKQGCKAKKGDDLVSDTESVKANNKDSCAICLDNLQEGQMVKALACTHKFHSKCINFWLKQKLKCPLCKERVNLNNYV